MAWCRPRWRKRGAETPPFEPAAGELYALGADPTGDWAGQAGKLALRVEDAWLFITPRQGWSAWDKEAGRFKVYDGAAWVQVVPDLNNLDGVGIGTAADAVNRLAVDSEASLFTHDGAGHQVKVNKSAAGDTASLLFQTGLSGRAEMGLAGNDDWSIKVSSDGASWTEALVLDKATGLPSGAAVQASPSDATAGRLLSVGGFGLGETAACPTISDMDDHTLAAGLWRMTASTSNRPFDLGTCFVLRNGTNRITQIAQQLLAGGVHGPLMYRHYFDGTWSAWSTVYSTGNLVGTVSESGGAPTGAVIERGSNANGEYVRFADGTQICTSDERTVDVTTAEGNGFHSAEETWTFPAAFSSAPGFITAACTNNTAKIWGTGRIDQAGSEATTGYFALHGWSSTGSRTVKATAVGRWF